MAGKQRSFVSDSDSGVERTFSNGSLTQTTRVDNYLLGWQGIDSEGHQVSKLGKTSRDIGGAFWTQKFEWSGGRPVSIKGYLSTYANRKEYDGKHFAKYNLYTSRTAPTGYGPLPLATTGTMNGYGAIAIARSLPTNPLVGMGQFLAELRDLPRVFNPSDWKDACNDLRKLARQLGKDHLNVQFGWVPLISDINKFFDVVNNSQKYVNRIVKGSGKHIRREREIYNNSSTTSGIEATNAYPYPVLNSNYYLTAGTRFVEETVSERVWFSGAFTYYFPKPPDTFMGRMKSYNRLQQLMYGTRADPELLWNIAPWTWASDWIANTGSVIHNWQAFQNDGLVMHYGYIMREAKRTVKWTLKGCRYRDNTAADCTQVLTCTSKQRHKATPYGFGVQPGTFTPRQWSIIAALGISHKPRAL